MSNRKQRSLLLLVIAVANLCLAGSVSAEKSASIQAVAHVEASLGMVDAVVERGTRNDDITPGSHLYWLYYPRAEGVLIQMSHPTLADKDNNPSSVSEIVRVEPDVLQIYPQVSLVDLCETTRACEGDSTALTLTLIFTNN